MILSTSAQGAQQALHLIHRSVGPFLLPPSIIRSSIFFRICLRKAYVVISNLVDFLFSGLSHSYSTHGDKNFPKLTIAVNSRRYEGRTPEAPAMLANQVS